MSKGKERRFKIDVFTPDTLPMERLAEYMLQFAMLLGETERVHFVDVSRGSAVLRARVEDVAVPKVERRLTDASRGLAGMTKADLKLLAAPKAEYLKDPKKIDKEIVRLRKKMKTASGELEFEEAAKLRDDIKRLELIQLSLFDGSIDKESATVSEGGDTA